MGSIRAWCWNLLPRRGHFAWHRARQCTDTRAFYIAALSIIFLLLGFRQWRFRTDRVWTLNMNIRLPLFWSTWSPALGPDSATCAGLAHGRDYCDCRASELKLQKCLATVFPWIVENTFKQRPTVRVFQPSLTGLDSVSTIRACVQLCCNEFEHGEGQAKAVSIRRHSLGSVPPAACVCLQSWRQHLFPALAHVFSYRSAACAIMSLTYCQSGMSGRYGG